MGEKIDVRLTVVALVIAAVFFTQSAFAADCGFGVEVFGDINPILTGNTGDGPGKVAYSDAFNTGYGGGIEFTYRLQKFSILLGGQYQRYGSDKKSTLSFDDYNVIPVYLGTKMHFLPSKSWWDIYARLDAGAAYTSSVKVNDQPFWKESWVPFFDIGGGVAYLLADWRIFLEAKAQLLGAPDGVAGKISDAEIAWTVPIRFGIGYSF